MSEQFSSPALAALRERPGYDAAADALAMGSLQEFTEADATGRWMFRDLGRSSLYLATIALHAVGGLTASALAAVARKSKIASRGRVMAFLRHAQIAGEVSVPPGTGAWTQRRLGLSERFIERFRSGNLVYTRAIARLAPEVDPLVPRLDEDAFFQRYIFAVAAANQMATQLGSAGGHREQLFLERDCGMSMLFRLMCSQPRPRERLLERARLSRAALAREFGVSRAHINRLLADATALGLLTCPESNLVVFSPTLSDDVDHMIVQTLQVTRAALLIAAQPSQ